MKGITLAVALLLVLTAAAGTGAEQYAVVIKEVVLSKPNWAEVVDTLVVKYDAEVFTYTTSVWEVQADLSAFSPHYVCFVTRAYETTSSFVTDVWQLTRDLDDDIYGDAIWGIVTGYTSVDAVRLVSGDGYLRVKNVLGGTMSCDLTHYPQVTATSEGTYNYYKVKHLDGTVEERWDGPTDRTEWLVSCLNADSVDMFVTSGHASSTNWQLHYPSADLEGFFRSSDGQVYGDPHTGDDININSVNPKIYFGQGNCLIGKIMSTSSMAICWMHTGGAYLYTGYVMVEGPDSYQHGATKSFFARQAHYTWPEAFFLGNQNLLFDIENSTPGPNPPDRDGSVLYGDPAFDAKVSEEGIYAPLLYVEDISIVPGADADTFTVRVTMNIDGKPGFTSKWGYRHPTVLLPERVQDVTVQYTDAYEAVVTDNFVLLYVWTQGDPDLLAGETREVIFTAKREATAGVRDTGGDPGPDSPALIALKVVPNPFGATSSVVYQLREQCRVTLDVYNVKGQLVRTLADEPQAKGVHSQGWDLRDAHGTRVPPGVYFCEFAAGGSAARTKLVVLK
jgi:zinc protease